MLLASRSSRVFAQFEVACAGSSLVGGENTFDLIQVSPVRLKSSYIYKVDGTRLWTQPPRGAASEAKPPGQDSLLREMRVPVPVAINVKWLRISHLLPSRKPDGRFSFLLNARASCSWAAAGVFLGTTQGLNKEEGS